MKIVIKFISILKILVNLSVICHLEKYACWYPARYMPYASKCSDLLVMYPIGHYKVCLEWFLYEKLAPSTLKIPLNSINKVCNPLTLKLIWLTCLFQILKLRSQLLSCEHNEAYDELPFFVTAKYFGDSHSEIWLR